jgi:hypothetical protein
LPLPPLTVTPETTNPAVPLHASVTGEAGLNAIVSGVVAELPVSVNAWVNDVSPVCAA